MLELVDIVFLTHAIQAVITVVGAFLLLRLFNRVLTRVIEAKNEDRKRAINNVKRFLQIITYSIALIMVL